MVIPKSVGFLQKPVRIVLDQVFFFKDFVHGYEIGYNSSFIQQLPDKNKPRRFGSGPLCPMQSNLWIAGNGENH